MGYLTPEEHARVSAAVHLAEATTAGEIVTVLAEESDGYSDVALWWAVVLAFAAMGLVALDPEVATSLVDGIQGGWGFDWTPGALLTFVTGIGVAILLALWALQLWTKVRLALVPAPIKSSRVRDAAVRHFKVGAERRTHGRTGVLIYLSMREHRAEIVADEAIALKVPAEVWGEAMADMLGHIRQGRIAEGLAAGIEDVGKVLAEHFPRHEGDINELPDRLIEV